MEDEQNGRDLGGRPTTYRPEFVELARNYASLGATNFEIAGFLGVCQSTFYTWKSAHPDFAAALKVGADVADQRVEDALYHRALGYSHDAVKIHVVDKAVVETPYVEHFPPDTQAASLWLRNRRPDKWRDKVDHEHSGGVNVTITGAAAEL